MSAFICSTEQFLAIAVACTQAGIQNGPISVRHEGKWHKIEPGFKKLASGVLPVRVPASYLAEILRLENSLSVSHRYSEAPEEFTPFTKEEFAVAEGAPLVAPYSAGYKNTEIPPTTKNIVAMIKAVHCYQYQACEHPEWKESFAKAATDALIDNLTHRFPDYEDAKWGAPVLENTGDNQ